MPRNPKCLINDTVIEVCFRTEEGLPFVENPIIKYALLGILAAAQSRYPVKLCHFVVMGNHVHLIFVVQDPEDVYKFIGYFKRESSHLVNRLLGRRKRTIWCEGYDSPVILDAEKVVSRIGYLYSNPTEAGLASSIDEYQNLSSWKQFKDGGSVEFHRRLPRNSIPKLVGVSESRDDELLEILKQSASEITHCLIIEPNAWMRCFEESRFSNPDTLNEKVVTLIRLKELLVKQHADQPDIRPRLSWRQAVSRIFNPTKWGKRSVCLSSRRELSQLYLSWYRATGREAKEFIAGLKRGIKLSVVPGFFLPGGGLISNFGPAGSPLPVA